MLMLDANGQAITPRLARQFRAQMALKFGPFIDDLDDLDFWFEAHPSQISNWEACGTAVQPVRPNDATALPPHLTFMGFPLESNAHLNPTVILLRKGHEVVGEIARLGVPQLALNESLAEGVENAG